MVVRGAYASVLTMFNAADALMGLMATLNIIAIALLFATVAKLTRDYRNQWKLARKPVFHVADHPELAEEVDATVW